MSRAIVQKTTMEKPRMIKKRVEEKHEVNFFKFPHQSMYIGFKGVYCESR